MSQSTPLPLWLKMILGISLGIVTGWILSPHGFAPFSPEVTTEIGGWIALPGVIFMALIKMVVIPLVLCSITLAVYGGGDMGYLKTAGSRIALYFISTTTVAVVIGIGIANFVEPGLKIDSSMLVEATAEAPTQIETPYVEIRSKLPDMLAGLLPTNPAKAVVDRSMLQIVIAAILFGLALLTMTKKHAKPLVDLCNSGQEVSMVVVGWAMKIAPIAVFSFLCSLTIKLGPDTLVAMSYYVGSVVLGLLCLLVMYVTIAVVLGKRKPFEFLSAIRNAQILAFSTSSSAATMPLSLKTAEEKLKTRPEIARFVVPLGTTINMDGTALYQIIAALFLTQVFGITLTTPETIILAVTIIAASIGSPGSPGVGLVILSTILAQIGVSPAGIALILGVDRILDMCRTSINVTGDLTASVVMDRWLKDKDSKTSKTSAKLKKQPA